LSIWLHGVTTWKTVIERIKWFVVDLTTRNSFGKGSEIACYGFRGRIQVLWGLKLIRFWETCLRKRVKIYAYKIRYEIENLFRMRKEITTHNILIEGDKYHKHHRFQKNSIKYL